MSVTAEQVKAYREEYQVGMQGAKRILAKADRLRRLDDLRSRVTWRDARLGELIAIVQEMNE